MTIYEIVHEVLKPLERDGTDYLLVGAIATGAWARFEEIRRSIPEI